MQVFHTTSTGKHVTYLELGSHAYLVEIDKQKILFLFVDSEKGYDLLTYNVEMDLEHRNRNIDEIKEFAALFKEVHKDSLLLV